MVEGVSWVGAAGYDYRELVKKLMEVERRPINSMQKRQMTIDATKSAWSDIRMRLQNLKARLTDLQLPSIYGAKKASSTNEAVVAATPNSTAVAGSYVVTVSSLATAHVVASDAQASASNPLNLTGSFVIRGTTVNVAATDSLVDIKNKINAAGGGVTASVVDNRLILKATSTGTANAITVDADSDGILGALGVVTAGTTIIKNQIQAAADASLTIDGLSVTRSTNQITDVLPGVTLTLTGAGTATINVAPDPQVAIEKVKAFVEQYNSVMDLIQQKLSKGGQLQGDPTLARLERMLREHVSGVVAGLADNCNSLSDIGVATQGSTNGGSLVSAMSGKIFVDEAKLRNALETNPVGVQELFYASSTSINGVAEVLARDIDLYISGSGGVILSKENELARRRADLDKQIKRLEELLDKRERTMLDRFIAADRVLMRLQQQGNTLMSFLSPTGR